MSGPGVLYVIEQLGQALAQANEHIARLTAELDQHRPKPTPEPAPKQGD